NVDVAGNAVAVVLPGDRRPGAVGDQARVALRVNERADREAVDRPTRSDRPRAGDALQVDVRLSTGVAVVLPRQVEPARAVGGGHGELLVTSPGAHRQAVRGPSRGDVPGGGGAQRVEVGGPSAIVLPHDEETAAAVTDDQSVGLIAGGVADQVAVGAPRGGRGAWREQRQSDQRSAREARASEQREALRRAVARELRRAAGAERIANNSNRSPLGSDEKSS